MVLSDFLACIVCVYGLAISKASKMSWAMEMKVLQLTQLKKKCFSQSFAALKKGSMDYDSPDFPAICMQLPPPTVRWSRCASMPNAQKVHTEDVENSLKFSRAFCWADDVRAWCTHKSETFTLNRVSRSIWMHIQYTINWTLWT